LNRRVGKFPVWDPQVVGNGLLNGTTANAWPRQGLDNVSCLINHNDVMIANFMNMSTADYGTVNVPVGGHLCSPLCPMCSSKYTQKCSQNLSDADGLTITYSSTADAWIQIRTGTLPHGGDHNLYTLRNTSGVIRSVSLPWDAFQGGTEPIAVAVAEVYSFTLACLGKYGSANLLSVSYLGFLTPVSDMRANQPNGASEDQADPPGTQRKRPVKPRPQHEEHEEDEEDDGDTAEWEEEEEGDRDATVYDNKRP